VSARRASALAALLFAALAVAWGFNFLFVRVGLALVSPLWFATLRSAVAAGGLLAARAVPSQRVALTRRDWRDALALGMPNSAVFFGLWFVSANFVPPGQLAVIVYTYPLWVALLSAPVLGARPNRSELVGIAVGFGGVALVTEPWNATSAAPVWAVVALLAAAVSWSVGTVALKRRFPPKLLPATNLPQLLAASVALGVAALVAEPRTPPALSIPLLIVVAYLGLVGTAFAYTAWSFLLGRLSAATLGAYLFLVPIVALVASVLLLGERTDPVEAVGVAVVLAAIYLVGRGQSRPGSPGTDAPAPSGAVGATPPGPDVGPGPDGHREFGATARRFRGGPARWRE
jgi:probable blue pigment (indigoidine) exporter